MPKFQLNKRRIITTVCVVLGAIALYLLCAFIWALTLAPGLTVQYQTSRGASANTLSPEQLAIVKKVEDPSFDSNIGMDISTAGQGATTITQSLARDIYLDQPINGVQGAPQVIFGTVFKLFKKIDLGRDVMAIALHIRTPRETLLDMFVTHAYMGSLNSQPIYGLPQAAKAYYNREISDLSEHEFISLVAMLDSPEGYNLQTQHTANADRTAKIKRLIKGTCAPSGLLDNSYKAC